MTDTEPVLCSECGWTGDQTELETGTCDYQCPVCAEAVENVG